MERLNKYQRIWTAGALTLFLSAVAIASIGTLVGILFMIAGELFGLSERVWMSYFALSAILWAPPAVGAVMKSLSREWARRPNVLAASGQSEVA
jgi:hypothetical protein